MTDKGTNISALEDLDISEIFDENDLEAYRIYVERMSQKSDGTIILNRGPRHAAVILSCLLKRSSSQLEILTNKLSPDVYGDANVIASASEFLQSNPNASIRILHEEEIQLDQHPFFKALECAGLMDRVKVSRIPEAIRNTYRFNFAVADKKSYRFEKDRNSFESVVQFGDAKTSEVLSRVFDILS